MRAVAPRADFIGRWSEVPLKCRPGGSVGVEAVAMVRVFSVMAAMALAVGGCGIDTEINAINTAPYLWPTPAYGVPFTQTSFVVRYNNWWNNGDEVRAVIAKYCGSGYDVARVSPTSAQGTALHPDTLMVWCGSSPQPVPKFRGHDVGLSYLISLNPTVANPAPAQPVAP